MQKNTRNAPEGREQLGRSESGELRPGNGEALVAIQCSAGSSVVVEMRRDVQLLLEQMQAIVQEVAALRERLVEAGPTKEYYTTTEAAKVLGKRPFTVREWCRHGRVRAEKALSGRGIDGEWRISRVELERIQNEGLLPPQRGGRAL